MKTLYDEVFNSVDLNKIAIIDENNKYTYKKLKNDCDIVYLLFKQKYGLKKKICICLPNCYLNVVLFLVSAKLQYKIFPINTKISKNNFINYSNKFKFNIYILDNIDLIKTIHNKKINNHLSTKNIYKILDNNNISVKNNNYSSNKISTNRYLIILSSGSTGDPKPIILSQRNKYLRSKFAGETYKFTKNEVIILPYQLDHSVGQRLMFMSLFHNGTLVLTKNFEPKVWYKLCIKHSVTFSILVSFHIKNILQKNFNLKKLTKLKNLVSVSDILEEKVRKKINKYKFDFHEIYGAAEISTVANIRHRKNSKSKSVGKILDFVDVKIIDHKYKSLKDGKIGQIVCKTPLIFEKYYNRSKLTSDSFYKNYFITGDFGYIKNNFLFYIGRSKNIIKVSGLSVFPEDIEKIIKKLKYVNDCVVKSEYDKNTGNKVVAIIVGKKQKEDDIYFYCLNNLEPHQIPTKFYFVKKIPKTFLGKIDRKLI